MYNITLYPLPGYGYSGNVYKKADDRKQLNAIISDAKRTSAYYRISVNDIIQYESKGSGAKKRWYRP